MKNISDIIKSSVLAAFSNEVTKGSLKNFLRLKKEFQIDVIKSLSDQSLRKKLAKRLGILDTPEILTQTVVFKDHLNLSGLVKKAFYQEDFSTFDKLIQKQIKKELPKLEESLNKKIEKAQEQLEFYANEMGLSKDQHNSEKIYQNFLDHGKWGNEDEELLKERASQATDKDLYLGELSKEIDKVDESLNNQIEKVIDIQNDLGLDFEQLEYFGLNLETYTVDSSKLSKIIRERENRIKGLSDSVHRKIDIKEESGKEDSLEEDLEITSSISKLAISDESLNVFDPQYTPLTKSLNELVELQRKKRRLEEELSVAKKTQSKILREVDKLWLTRKEAKKKFFNDFEASYGDDTAAKLAFEVMEGQDRLQYLNTISKSPLWSEVRSRDIVSTVFNKPLSSLSAEQDFMLAQIFEKLFYGLPVGRVSELVLTHPNWGGLEFKIKPERAEEFNTLVRDRDQQALLNFIKDNKDFKAVLQAVVKDVMQNKNLNEIFPERYPEYDKPYQAYINSEEASFLSEINKAITSKTFRELSTTEVIPRLAGDSDITPELDSSEQIERKDSGETIKDSVGRGSIYLDSPFWNDLGIDVFLPDDVSREFRLAQQEMTLTSSIQELKVKAVDLPSSNNKDEVIDLSPQQDLATKVFRNPALLTKQTLSLVKELMEDDEIFNAVIDFVKEDSKNFKSLPQTALEMIFKDDEFNNYIQNKVKTTTKFFFELPRSYQQELLKVEEIQEAVKSYEEQKQKSLEQSKKDLKKRDLEGDSFAQYLFNDPLLKEIITSLDSKVFLNNPLSKILPELIKQDSAMSYDDLEALSDEERELQKLPSPEEAYAAYNKKLLEAFRESKIRLKESLFDFERMDEDFTESKYPDSFANLVLQRREIDIKRLKEELGLEPSDILLATKKSNPDDKDRAKRTMTLIKALEKAGLITLSTDPTTKKVVPSKPILKVLIEEGYISKDLSGVVKPLRHFVDGEEVDFFLEDVAFPKNNIITSFFDKLADLSYSSPNVSLKNFLDRSAANWTKVLQTRETRYSDKFKDMSSLVGDNDGDGDVDVLDNLRKFINTTDFDNLLKDEYSHLGDKERQSYMVNMLNSFAEKHHLSHEVFSDLKDDIRAVLNQPETQRKLLNMMDTMSSGPEGDKSFSDSTRFQEILIEGFDELSSKSTTKNKALLVAFVNSLKDNTILDITDKDVQEELKNWVSFLEDSGSEGSTREVHAFDSLIDKLFTPEVSKNLDKEINSVLQADLSSEMIKKLPKNAIKNLKVRTDFFNKVGKVNLIEILRRNKLPTIIGPTLFNKLTRDYLTNATKFARLTSGAFLFEFFVLPYLRNVVLGRDPLKTIENELQNYFKDSKFQKDILKNKWIKMEEQKTKELLAQEGNTLSRNEARKQVRDQMKADQSSILKELKSEVSKYIEEHLPQLLDEKKFKKDFTQILNKTKFIQAVAPLFFMNTKFMEFDEEGNLYNSKSADKRRLYDDNGEINPLSDTDLVNVGNRLRREWLSYSKRYFLPKLRLLLKSLGRELHLEDELPFQSLFEYAEEKEKQGVVKQDAKTTLKKVLMKSIRNKNPEDLNMDDILKSLNKDNLRMLPSVIKELDAGGKLTDDEKRILELDTIGEITNRETKDRKKLVSELLSLKDSKLVDEYFNLLKQHSDKKWLPNMLETEEFKAKNLQNKVKERSADQFNQRIKDVSEYMETLRSVVPKKQGESVGSFLENLKVKALEGASGLSTEERSIINSFDQANKTLRAKDWYKNRSDFEEALQSYHSLVGEQVANSYIVDNEEITEKKKQGLLKKTYRNFKPKMSDKKLTESQSLYDYYKDEPWFVGSLNKARNTKVTNYLLSNKLKLFNKFNSDESRRSKTELKELSKKYQGLDWFSNALDLSEKNIEAQINLLEAAIDQGDYDLLEQYKGEPWFSKVMDIVQAKRGKDLSVPLFSEKQMKFVTKVNLSSNKPCLSLLINKSLLSKMF